MHAPSPCTPVPVETPWRIFLVFLRLGLSSFGGPLAHLGYFRQEFVQRRRWLGEAAYAELVALCQFLPGPASSQVGIALGLSRRGLPGALCAWAGFTLPSALALALLAIGFTGTLAALLARLLPEEAQSDEPGMPRYLDEAGLEVANIGLANATREVLRLADMASLMLRATSGLLQRPEAKVVAEIRRQDQALDQLSAAIRAYLADLGQDGLGDSDADRAQEILLFAINIEHIGDLVANSLLPLAMRWAGRSRAGSEFELGRMLPLQAAIEESLHLAISAFLREDLDAALRLVARKKLLQRLEADASRERFRRLRDDRGAWVESGDVFQRILRDYRRIHHHVTALAYPLLERSGIDPMAKRPDEPGQGEGSACAS